MTPTSQPGPYATTQRPDGLIPPSKDARSYSVASFTTAKQAQSYSRSGGGGAPPGSFTADLKSLPAVPRGGDGSKADLVGGNNGGGIAWDEEDDGVTSEQRQNEYRQRIEREEKIKTGTENLLEALNTKKEKHVRDQRKQVESELNVSNRKIAQLRLDLETEMQKSRDQISPKARLSQLFRGAPLRSPDGSGQQLGEAKGALDPEAESPTYILAEILQALEVPDMQPDYYISQANDLVELFRRHPTLKYDLAWSIFGIRMQMLLLSHSREVVAAGYRVMRYAVTDRKSLKTIRSLHTDYLVILSLVKESRARVEREQALKFIRAFLDVKDGVKEIHPAVARIVVAVADHSDDQLRGIAILTLAEMLLKGPELVVNAGGVSVLAEATANGAYHSPETLIAPLLHLMDMPARREMLHTGFEFSSAFATFTEPCNPTHAFEERLRASARVVATMFKSWTGLMTLSFRNFLPVRSVVSSLYISSIPVRVATLDLLIDILRIKSPSWSASFIGGRRLTTYNRVANLGHDPQVAEKSKSEGSSEQPRMQLVEHFTAIALAMLLRQGLLVGLMHAEGDAPSAAIKRKTTLLIAEVLRMASDLLPECWSQSLQTLPGVFEAAADFSSSDRFAALATVYQVDSINRTLYRSVAEHGGHSQPEGETGAAARARAASKSQTSAAMDETLFRQRLLDTGVLSSVNYLKWDWPLIQELIEGPMANPARFVDAIKTTKFTHRLLGFLRPFKFRFSDAPNTKSNQRYVRMACSLIRCLLLHTDGCQYLMETKMIPQVAECLAQCDPASGITSQAPMFSPERLNQTLVVGYFTMLGAMSSDQKGIQILVRWKIVNIFYHLVELKERDDLVRVLLTNLDYTLDSHPRIILSKAMVAGSKQMRIMATRLLRKYAMMPVQLQSIVGGGPAEWAIRLLVGQLYDPEVEVCEVAIRILEEACNNLTSLEYVVKCRPALDHLGEIGAPLLLRFLSTSVGYHYLDGLDYITKEMDDWFLGRNDSYVTLVEASLARALADVPEKPGSAPDESPEPQNLGSVPPHFYRELTRTTEGCELLKAKGHFEEFAHTIQTFATEADDAETILKVKGSLWAVGNVGSMELGARFLEQTSIVSTIVQIAETSLVLTLRGTAFFVLGLISRSLHGQEILAEHGWDGTMNVLGESLGYVLPLHFTKLFFIPPSTTSLAVTSGDDQRRSMRRARHGSVTDRDPENEAILASITKLGNTVLTNKALGELNACRQKRLDGFRSPALFRKVMVLLASHGYGIPQWRFVIDLFDKQVLRKIVLEEEEDEESEDGDGDGGGDGNDDDDEDEDEDEDDSGG